MPGSCAEKVVFALDGTLFTDDKVDRCRMDTPDNRRRNPRFACNGPAEVQLVIGEAPLSAKMLNISAEGALVELLTPHAVALDARIELTFTVHHLLFRVRADVRAARPCGLQLGCQFFSLSQRMLLQIQDLVEELARDEGVHIPRLAPLH